MAQINQSQQRILKVMLCLSGHEIHGMETGEVAKSMDISITNSSRDLSNLEYAGIAEKMNSGRWRLTTKLIEIPVAMYKHLDEVQAKINELRQL
ncbi:MAG: hypothetical protein QM504_06530 [Pseudomonadota bacterium]